jgi:trehalose 6-phosphate phosphatase
MTDSEPRPPLSLLAGAALFLDFDGTLVELAEAPDAIVVPQRLPLLLASLSRRLEGRLAVVSGRAIADLGRFLPLEGIAVSGSHGLELRFADGRGQAAPAPAGFEHVRESIAAFAARASGLLLEEKPASLALHYRQAPEREEEVLAFVARLAAGTGFAVQRGKMVAELRPPGPDKGSALRSLLAEPPFAGARPVFVGDDLTDEDAFAAAAALGGDGILVGPARSTAAAWRLPDVPAVLDWLEEAADFADA